MKRLIALGLLLGLAVPGMNVRAQAPGSSASAATLPAKKYTHSRGFKLPFSIDEKDRAGLDKVQLYVKTSPGEAWSLNQSVTPTDAAFTFRALQDGEYWFLVVTVDKSGVMAPGDLSKEGPGVIVVIDTQAPELDVRPLRSASGETMLQCEMRDANPDYSTVRLEYQAADKSWKPLEAMPELGIFRVTDPSVLTGVVRVSASDRAGNPASREINLAPAPAVTVKTVPDTCTLCSHTEPRSEACATVTPVESHCEKVALSPGRQLINGTHATLEYQIDQQGPSGVGKVEVWLTRDDGQTWQRLCEDPNHRSPVDIDLPGEGLFGIKVVASNGRGFGGTPPVKGDTPDWWVEVDTTRPQAQLLGAEPGTGSDNACLVINWTASDKNLSPEPVDLYFATRVGGPWQPIVKGVKNNGCYRWTVPQDVGPQLFVRLEVTDRAGNSCRCDLQQAVVLDLSRPKVRVLGIAASGPRTGTPAGN
jgi:hypothetical protein